MELNFRDLNISENIQKALEEIGYENATPIQAEAIPTLLEGKDVIGLAQTGTGKTCAFGLPLIEKIDLDSDKVQGIVIAPTRELALQITNELRKFSKYVEGLRILTVYGGESIDKQITSLKKRPQIIVGTPGRIMDHMRRRTLRLNNVNMVVLDEADEMLNMGFKEDIDTILKDITHEKQMVMFSATFNDELHEIAETYQKEPLTINVRKQQVAALNIKQCLIETTESNKLDAVTRILDGNSYRCSIIFCNTKRKVDEVCEYLHIHGYRVKALHGDMKQKERDFVMNLFRKSQLDILVATDVAARGIDVDEVDAVINYDVPEDDEYYVHRIGRCGRAGREGVSYLLATKRQKHKLKFIEKLTKVPLQPVDVPTARDIKEKQIEDLINEIRAIDKIDENADEYIRAVANVTGMDLHEVAGVLFTLLIKKSCKEIKDDIANFDVEPGHVRIYINLGSEQHCSPATIIKAIASQTGIAGKNIGAIDINGYYSYFEVPEKYEEKVLNASETFECL
ncbi:MAG: DEAD/DEAH box helicase, partial [Erysipelotrichales bacterium]|nr:DEAD/DEAH box helicase [Erysipelotrichales bacterium]